MEDIYTRITQKIITEIERGTPPWVKPWSGETDPHPRNALSQRHYRGINNLLLGMECDLNGYQTNQWLTFRQAHQLGGHVRKGEHATSVVYFEMRMLDKDGEDLVADSSEPEKRFIPLVKVFNVFNIDQVDGLSDTLREVPTADTEWCGSETAEQIIQQSGAVIRHQGFRAFYSPPNDQIYLPAKASFASTAAYYSTALHELCHWTSHASRLGRKLGRRFGDSAYAMEELVAEMGSAFLCAQCRIDGQLQHASYFQNWLDVLKRDKRALFVAAAQAQKAADYLLTQAGLIEPTDALPLAA